MNPKPLPQNVLELIKVYQNAQTNLIKIISEKQARGNVTDYYRTLLKKVDSELISLNKQAIAWTGKNIPLEYQRGANKVISDLNKQGIKDIGTYSSFAMLHKSAIEVIVQNTLDDLVSANQFVGRQVRDAIRKAGIETATKQLTTGITTTEAKKDLMNTFVDMGINGIQTSDGRYINLASYAETVARSTVREASNRGTLNQATALGYGLVKMSRHGTACKVCQQYEGRVYSIDGKDKRFPPLRTAYKPPFANIHPNCFSFDTEIYTNEGWKYFKDLNKNELVYTINPKTMTPEWQKPSNYIKYKHEGKMYHIHNVRNDLMITENHNILYQNITRKGWTDFKLEEVSKVEFNGSKRMNAGCNWNGNDVQEIDGIRSDLFCKVLAYYLADGSVHDNTSIKIAQQNNDWMYDELKELPFNVKRYEDKIIIRSKEFRDYCKQFGTCIEKYVPEIVKALSKELINIFLMAYAKTDGSIKQSKPFGSYASQDEIVLFTTSNKMASDLGELILKAGYRPSYYLQKSKGREVEFKNGKYTINNDIWRIRLCKQTNIRLSNLTVDLIDYNDYVYCVEVPEYNTLLVRRNGKVIWSGNCRHTISVYVDELARKEELESDIEYSNRPFKEPTKKDKSLDAYNAEQEKKRKLNANRRQYENYKFTFGKDAPKSLAGFRRMKASNSEKWQELQSEYRSIRMQK